MTTFYEILASVVGLTLVTGLAHVLRSRRRADALLAAQLAGTCAVGIILLLGKGTGTTPVSLDLALVAALLAALTAIAFAALGWREPPKTPALERGYPGTTPGRPRDNPGMKPALERGSSADA